MKIIFATVALTLLSGCIVPDVYPAAEHVAERYASLFLRAIGGPDGAIAASSNAGSSRSSTTATPNGPRIRPSALNSTPGARS